MNGIDLMTRDDILNMPAGRELDLLIALKVMGWEHNSLGDAWIREGEPWVGCDEFQPSVDIAAAWEVVERLKELGVYLTICTLENDYQCELDRLKTYELACDSVISETAPLAICRAALLAVMETGSPS